MLQTSLDFLLQLPVDVKHYQASSPAYLNIHIISISYPKEGLFNEQWLLEILSYKKPPVRKVVFNQNKLDSYFEPNMTNEDIEGIIVKLLEEWKMKGGQV